MTAMLIVGSPLAGALINKLGPRLPIVAGMAMAAVAMFGLARLGATASPNDTIIWFVLLGLGLAPAQLADVAGGLQSTAMQLGGTFGIAMLGAIMSARIDSLLSGHAAPRSGRSGLEHVPGRADGGRVVANLRAGADVADKGGAEGAWLHDQYLDAKWMYLVRQRGDCPAKAAGRPVISQALLIGFSPRPVGPCVICPAGSLLARPRPDVITHGPPSTSIGSHWGARSSPSSRCSRFGPSSRRARPREARACLVDQAR